jgi:hypothetical protein
MDPGFAVPAEYFYALGASQPMGLSASDRFALATRPGETQLALQLQAAIDAGVIPDNPGGQTPLQAARRLVALGTARATTVVYSDESTYTVPQNAPNDPVFSLIDQWLNAPDPSGDWQDSTNPDTPVWTTLLTAPPSPASQAQNDAAQLRLVACALTGWNDPTLADFLTAIGSAPLNVQDADDLASVSAGQWTTFFNASSYNQPNARFLPTFTQPPGTTVATGDRIIAFLRYVQRFYEVAQDNLGIAQSLTPGTIPLLDRYGYDPLATYLILYDNANPATPYVFGTSASDDAAAKAAADAVFPNDSQAQQWLLWALTVINELIAVTNGVPSGVNATALQFSIVEALYARGFTSKVAIAALDQADFTQALTGSVAFQWADQIWTNAGGTTQPPGTPSGTFKPINAGELCNCVPQPHLSPLGPVQYLRELLDAGPASTCAQPTDPANSFGALLKPRRGDLGALSVTKTNLDTPLPVIDLVNECLEYLAAQVSASGGSVNGVGGVVHDTADSQVRDHHLRAADTEPTPADPDQHDPGTLLATLPEHSSPASPVDQPSAYSTLAEDYSRPDLPYAQPLDVSREHLGALGTSRYEVMRRFRTEITEFALDPTGSDPAGFDATVWRYPVRRDIAPEYLQISTAEYQQLFVTPIATTAPLQQGQLGVWQLYGFPDPHDTQRG